LGPQPFQGTVHLCLTFLADKIGEFEEKLQLAPNTEEKIHIPLPLPPEDGRGYGVEAVVTDSGGQVVARGFTALNVLSRWTMAPRYGFLCDFPPDRNDVEETMEWLTRYHINGLQFYDWMYRHEDLLTEQEPYRDPLRRLLSRRTVRALIDAAHHRNIAAMAYAAVYGASVTFWQAHPDWALHDAEGNPIPFGQDFLYIMDPSPDSPWTQHLLAQFAEAVREMSFDGIHLDQYGDPKEGFDARGRPVDITQAFCAFINWTRETLTALRPDAAVVFNAVNNWPIESVAQAQQDFLYIEVWPPHTRYCDLWSLILNARRQGGGKPVVLAAYIPPTQPYNVRLTDAVIFASGGYHIELGERGGMLADPYFPKYQRVNSELAMVLRRYYDFTVQYENVLALDTEDTTQEWAGHIFIEGVEVTNDGSIGRVWVMTREGNGVEVIHLINLVGIPTAEWTEPLPAGPSILKDLQVRYYTEQKIQRIWLASPDFASPQAIPVEFDLEKFNGKNYVKFLVPRLEYWDLVVLE
jgi:dextranase